MGSLYLDRKNLTLTLDGKRLRIDEPGARPRSLPLELLERVVIRARTHLDSGLLAALAAQGSTVVCLAPRNGRRAALVLGHQHGDARRRLAQYRLQDWPELRLAWTRALLRGKLRGQHRTLADALAARPDRRKALGDAIGRLDQYLAALDGSDEDGCRLSGAEGLAVLRGLEGAAAAAYFAALQTLFAPELAFTGRNRRPPRDPVNACLSLGYTLLHAEAVAACHGAGLDPMLGFFHAPTYGRESLACDLVEPLRPRLDAWIWGLFRERLLRADLFREDKGACLLDKTGREHFYAAYETRAPRWRRYLRLHSYRLARELTPLAPDYAGEPAP